MTARSSSSSTLATLGDLIRKESSLTVPGLPKTPMSSAERRFGLGATSEHWQDVANQVTALFQTKRMTMKLHTLTEKVKRVKSEVGKLITDFFKESILKKGMIILREEVKEKSGEYLDKLETCWTVFFCNILPTLQAIFASLPQANGLAVREISLVYFRDIVVLKTKLDEVIASGAEMPPRIVQMLLVLQSVHDPNIENYQKLEKLVGSAVTPYLSTSSLKDSVNDRMLNSTSGNEMTEQHSLKSHLTGNERLDPVLEVDTGSQRSISSMSTVVIADTIASQNVSTNLEEFRR